MDKRALENLYQWESKKNKLLMEIGSLTGQLTEVMARNDKVAVSMVLNMRQDPIAKAEEVAGEERAYVLTLPEEDAPRATELLDGAEAVAPEEERLARIVALHRGKLSKLLEEDKRLSLQLGGRHSFYEKFRDQ